MEIIEWIRRKVDPVYPEKVYFCDLYQLIQRVVVSFILPVLLWVQRLTKGDKVYDPVERFRDLTYLDSEGLDYTPSTEGSHEVCLRGYPIIVHTVVSVKSVSDFRDNFFFPPYMTCDLKQKFHFFTFVRTHLLTNFNNHVSGVECTTTFWINPGIP